MYKKALKYLGLLFGVCLILFGSSFYFDFPSNRTYVMVGGDSDMTDGDNPNQVEIRIYMDDEGEIERYYILDDLELQESATTFELLVNSKTMEFYEAFDSWAREMHTALYIIPGVTIVILCLCIKTNENSKMVAFWCKLGQKLKPKPKNKKKNRTVICVRCGEEIDETSKFCPVCGLVVAHTPTHPPVAPPTQSYNNF